jgi:hypothetical protein
MTRLLWPLFVVLALCACVAAAVKNLARRIA